MIYGYCRISRKEQSIERQERNIKAAYPSAVLFSEAYTGRKIEGRQQLAKLLKVIQSGDIIVFDSVSRMARNAADGIALYKQLFAAGVELVFLKEPMINTETFKAALDQHIQIEAKTGDEAADEFLSSVTAAINTYMIRLAEKQIELAFQQAQKEVDDLRQRTREGLITARANGKQIGQVEGKKLNIKKAAPAKAAIRKYSRDFDGTLTDAEAMKLIGIARNTYYKYKKELTAELSNAL